MYGITDSPSGAVVLCARISSRATDITNGLERASNIGDMSIIVKPTPCGWRIAVPLRHSITTGRCQVPLGLL